MLQYLNDVYLKLACVDRKEYTPPTVYLDIYKRNSTNVGCTFIGQIRFNFDSNYSSLKEEIRMAFNVFDASLIDPVKSNLLEDIIVAGFLWITLDNHYIYDFNPKPYMVIHDYKEDVDNMKFINKKAISILKSLKCKENDNDMFIFSKDITSEYLSNKLMSSSRK